MKISTRLAWLLPALLCSLPTMARSGPAPDRPDQYSHALPLHISGKNALVQLRLPPAAYRHARGAQLEDLRIFDAAGHSLPYALRQPRPATQVSTRALPAAIFPVLAEDTALARDNLEIRTSDGGSITAITTRAGALAQQVLSALVLDFGAAALERPIDALEFTPPAGIDNYEAEVTLEVSDDLRRWETLGYASLAWLSNSEQQTLASKRMELPQRAFRYGRLVWRTGKPLRFAAIHAQVPVAQPLAAPLDSISVPAQAGRYPQDLVYEVGPAVPAEHVSLAFGPGNVVLPASLGYYLPLPAPRGQPVTRWEFVPRVNATFYQFVQNGVTRRSGEVAVDGLRATQWVLRPSGALPSKPALTLSWHPATLVFMASGQAPYSIQVGREGAVSTQRAIGEVAPGLSEAELGALEQAGTGPVQVRAAAGAAQDDTTGLRRKLVLWGVLLLGVAVLGAMAWKLTRQMKDAS